MKNTDKFWCQTLKHPHYYFTVFLCFLFYYFGWKVKKKFAQYCKNLLLPFQRFILETLVDFLHTYSKQVLKTFSWNFVWENLGKLWTVLCGAAAHLLEIRGDTIMWYEFVCRLTKRNNHMMHTYTTNLSYKNMHVCMYLEST